MNRQRDFDETLTAWLDEGAQSAPERFVWAALERVDRTPQRGAWRISLEELIMQLKPAAPILGVVVVAALAVAVYTFAGAPGIGGQTSRTFTPADLEGIVLGLDSVPDGWTLDGTVTGQGALRYPLPIGAPALDDSGFQAGRINQFGEPDEGDDWGGYASWSVVFETEEDAERIFDHLVEVHESPDGWGAERSLPEPPLGDESAAYAGPMYGYDNASVYVWRVNNLLLAAVGVDAYESSALRSLADDMDARAR